MSIIIYGGAKETVKKQLACSNHDWHGPCMGDIARYYKCLKCFCINYDLSSEQKYFDTVKERHEVR